MKAKKEIKIKYDGDVIGIPLDNCFQCGKPNSTRHHVIPTALKPKTNATIPLCEEHKDLLHPIVKQFYFPKKLRRKIGKIKKHSEDILSMINSLTRELQFHNKVNATKFHLTTNDEKTCDKNV